MSNSSNNSRQPSPRGFTLIELLVVIAILAILALLGFGVAAKATKKARSMSCVQNLREWSLVFASCAADRNGRFPTPANWAAISHQAYNPDLENPGRSPYVDYWNEDIEVAMGIQLEKRACPCLAESISPSGNPAPTYLLNRNLSNRANGYLDVTLTNLERPASQILFIDGDVGSPLNLEKQADIARWVTPAAAAHGGTVNAVFADLHVEPIRPEDLEENWKDLLTNSVPR